MGFSGLTFMEPLFLLRGPGADIWEGDLKIGVILINGKTSSQHPLLRNIKYPHSTLTHLSRIHILHEANHMADHLANIASSKASPKKLV